MEDELDDGGEAVVDEDKLILSADLFPNDDDDDDDIGFVSTKNGCP
jgi:hypothetical protein